MLVTIARAGRGSTVATIHRRDGVVLELPGYDRKFRVPHDLAHAVTERELGLSRGVFGSVAGGGMFTNVRVLTGRPRHDAAERSRRLLTANKHELGMAELMAGAVHHAAEHATDPAPEARRAWASLTPDPFPWPDDRLREALKALIAESAAYHRDGVVHLDWPDRLTSPMPSTEAHPRGRRGRI
jgi:hypothetical protein